MFKKWFLLCLCVSSCWVYAAERITDFSSHMKVNTDGSVQVTEGISVIAEHDKIRRGIVRELPSRYDQSIQILSVSMDGQKHPFFIEKKPGSSRVNFGNDNYIEQGPHTYQLQYTMDNVVGLFWKHDEIYWNVTGSNWDFPIDKASFELELPNGARVDESLVSSYVGRRGTKGTQAKRNGLTFYATSLTPGNDFTIAVPWQKGLITPPKDYYFVKYGITILLLIGLILLWLYYFWAWNRVGRDPKARVFTQYEPPENFSAAKTLYLYSMGHAKNLLLPTAVLSLAMKDALTIHHEKGFIKDNSYMERKLTTFSPLLSQEEAFILPALFRGKKRVKLSDPSNAKDFQTIYKELEHVLKEQSEPYFTTNKWYNIPTFVYLIVGGFMPAIFSNLNPGLFSCLLIAIVFFTHACLQRPIPWKTGIFPWAFSVLYIFLYADIAFRFSSNFSYTLLLNHIILIIAAIVGGLFMQWIKAYSVFGRSLVDHIEGFKHYLELGEAGRIAQSNPTDPLRTFCDYLPYAYALGIENKWIKSFEKNFSAQQISSVLNARGFYGVNPSSFSSSMSSAFSSLSSGVGGHGSAGGGSGGGGGGGR